MPISKNETAAVVVTYNRSAILKENIKCLLNQKGTQCDIYIIDNASTDSTFETVKSFCDSRVHYFNTGSNLGGAGGFEFGIKHAVEDGYKFVWVMDDDTLPAETSLDELFRAGEKLNGKWGALSSAVYWTDGSVCKANRQKKSLFSFVSDDEIKHNEPVRLVMASFVSLFVKSEVIHDVGLPLGEYFIWTDDYEFTGRISRKYNLYLIPKSKVVHAMRKNRKINLAEEKSERIGRFKHVYRNDVHCYRQCGISGRIYLAGKFLYTLLNVLFYSEDRKLEKIRIMFNGFKEGFSFSPEVKYVNHVNGGGGQQR